MFGSTGPGITGAGPGGNFGAGPVAVVGVCACNGKREASAVAANEAPAAFSH